MRASRRPTARLREPDKAWIAATMRRMSLRDKVAQLVQVRAYGKFMNSDTPEFNQLADEVRRNHVGGIVLFAGNVYESAVLLNRLQALSAVPLIVSADLERGVSFRIADTTSFPWTMAVGAAGSEEYAFQQGAVTAREARALGVHWVFAPVMDVNNNPDNPVINIRSFGEDPALVARLGAAFIRGCRANGALTTAKHFPGHGDTATDSHIGLAVVPSDRARLDAVELVPFRSAIEAGVDSIMTAHVAVPQITGDAGTPATLSPAVLTDLLRESLGFKGIVATDALEMGGITTRYWTGKAAVAALRAGADVLLLPPDATVAINEVVRAVRRGALTESQINRSVQKLLAAKSRVGLPSQRTVSIDQIANIVASPDALKLAQEVADHSITLVRDQGGLLPIDPTKAGRIFSVVVSSDPDPSPGAVYQAELRRRFPSARTASVDPRTTQNAMSDLLKAAEGSDILICSTVVRVVSGRGSVGLPENVRGFVEALTRTGKPLVWITFGNPYVLRLFPNIGTYLCTFSYADVSYTAAAKALAGEIEISGKMPVSIPGHAKIGEGLTVQRLDRTLKPAAPAISGVSPEALRQVQEVLDSYVQSKAYPGAALVVGYRGFILFQTGAGSFDYQPKSQPVTTDTIYDLASLSKVVGTTSAAMMLVDSGKLILSAPVQDYLPEFEGPGKENVRVQDLLSHTSGLPAFEPLYLQTKGYDQMIKAVCAVPLQNEPGARMVYSDLGMILIGEIVSRAAGEPLDRFLAERLFGPLGMASTTYNPPRSLVLRIPPTEKDPWRKRVVRGKVHDENAYAMGGVSGHAGLFGSAHDLAVFAQLLLQRGWYDHRWYFQPDTLARFTAAGDSHGRGLGWGKPAPTAWSGRVFSPAAFGHTGFTGTVVWVDPGKQLFIVLLSNRVHPTRENPRFFDEAVEAIVNAVVAALPPAGEHTSH
jgi:beta-N-acetylhexosaminidase